MSTAQPGLWPAPAILSVAPNGARRTKADHPALPMNAAELAETAAACAEAGAALIHFHMRDKEGRHSLDHDANRAAIAAIRQAVGKRIIVQATTEAAGIYSRAEQIAFARAVKPEAITFAIREIFNEEAAEPEGGALLAWALAERILVQYVLYDANDVRRFALLHQRGLIPQPRPAVLYVLGRYASDGLSRPSDLVPFLALEQPPLVWSVCAFGPLEGACALAALSFGGNARIGFENNFVLHDGTRAAHNAALVAQAASDARRIGRRVANADEARALFGA
jgi:uncharacterized protein (DUF849 family)